MAVCAVNASGRLDWSLEVDRPDSPPLTITFWANTAYATVVLSQDVAADWYDNKCYALYQYAGPETYVTGIGYRETYRELLVHSEQWLHWAIVHDGDEFRVYVSTPDRVAFDVAVHSIITQDLAWTGVYLHYLYMYQGQALKEFRVWTAALTPEEIRAERDATTAVRTTDLYADFPLATHTDLGDISGNDREFTIYATSGQVVGTWTAAPYRQRPGTVTALTEFPTTVTIASNGQGAAFETWFTYTPTTDEYLSILPWVPYASNVRPHIQAQVDDPFDRFEGELSLFPPHDHSGTWSYTEKDYRQNYMLALFAGVTYYFTIWVQGTAYPMNADVEVFFTLQSKTAPSIPAGSILITDDSNGWPFLFLAEDDGEVLRAVNIDRYRGSDIGSVLPNGYVCLEWGWQAHDWPTWIALLNPQLGVVGTYTNRVDMPGDSVSVESISNNGTDTFYIASKDYTIDTYPTISTLTTAGDLSLNVWRLVNPPYGGVESIGVAHDESVLYYVNGVTGPIRRWDLVSDVLLDGGTFIAQTDGYWWNNKDLLTLSDGSLVVGHNYRSPPYTATVYRYNATGAVIRSYGGFEQAAVNRLCAGNDEPDSFWVWYFIYEPPNTSLFIHYRTSDGAILHQFTQKWAQQGEGPDYEDTDLRTLNPIDIPRFVHSSSCALLVLRETYTPGTETQTGSQTGSGGLVVDGGVAQQVTRPAGCIIFEACPRGFLEDDCPEVDCITNCSTPEQEQY
jgi:hypothetical protein